MDRGRIVKTGEAAVLPGDAEVRRADMGL